MDAKEFTFIGFLPQNKKNRKEKLEQIKNAENTLILYEAPHKLLQTLEELKSIIDKRKVVLAKELTKIHEEFKMGTIEELQKDIINPKGEYVIIIEKNEKTKEQIKLENLNNLTIEEHYKYYEETGLDKKEIIKKVAKDRNLNKNEVYKKFLKQ